MQKQYSIPLFKQDQRLPCIRSNFLKRSGSMELSPKSCKKKEEFKFHNNLHDGHVSHQITETLAKTDIPTLVTQPMQAVPTC